MTELTLRVEVNAPAAEVWAALTDWPAQSSWMLATTVRAVDPEPGVGQRVEAVTGLGRLGVLDTMRVTAWEPPRRCVVDHTGKVVRGAGIFEVVDLGDGRSQVVWTEQLDLPLGLLGRLGWPLVRPLMAAGVVTSLRRFAARVEAATRA